MRCPLKRSCHGILNHFERLLNAGGMSGSRNLGYYRVKSKSIRMSSFTKRLLLTVLIAGSLDLLAAYTDIFIRTGRITKKMFQYIAAGALGLQNSMNGGVPVILLGIFFHYFIVFCFTLFFFLLYRKNRFFGLNTYLIALIYGFFIWAVMNLVVLPLSALPPPTVNFGNALKAGLILTVAIGLPVSLSARASYAAARPAL
jgi:hypothetical protein